MSNPLYLSYYLHSLQVSQTSSDLERFGSVDIPLSGVSGVQSVSVSQSFETDTLPAMGNPFRSVNIYKKSNVDFSFSKFISNNVPPAISHRDLLGTGINRNISGVMDVNPLDFEILISYLPTGGMCLNLSSCSEDEFNQNGPRRIAMKDLLLKSMEFNFRTDSFFEETYSFQGHVIESGAISRNSFLPYINEKNRTEQLLDEFGNPVLDEEDNPILVNLPDKPYIEHTGITKRRQDFFISGIPYEVAKHLVDQTGVLLSANVSINIGYGEIPSFGRRYTAINKYITYPIDITTTFEILDLGRLDLDKVYESGLISSMTFQQDTSSPDKYIQYREAGYENYLIKNDPIHLGILGSLSIDLGSGNYLESKSRSGGDAGDGSYVTYSYTYKNSNSYFKIT